MASNPFDQFDSKDGNPFDQFDKGSTAAPAPEKKGFIDTAIDTLEGVSSLERKALGSILSSPSRAGEMAGEKVLGISEKLGTPPEVSAGLATAANMGVSIGAGGGIGGSTGSAAGRGIAKLADPIMENAIKPLLKHVESGKAATAIRTMLEEGLNVTQGGVRSLKQKIGELGEEIKSRLAQSEGGTVSKSKIMDKIEESLQKFRDQVNPQSDIAEVKKAFENFMTHPDLQGVENIPVAQAQRLKQGTYKQLGEKAYTGELTGANIDAQKVIAKGLKEGIESVAPEVKGLNAEQKKLIDTLNVVERRQILEAVKSPGGLGYLAHSPAAFAAITLSKSAAFKSALANLVKNAERPAGVLGAEVGAVSATGGQRLGNAP